MIRPVLVDYTRELNGLIVDHLEWIFEGEVLDHTRSERIRVDGSEISEARFVARAEIADLVGVLHRTRIARALAAIATGTFAYTDDEEVKTLE